METITLIFPSKEYERQVLDYKNEFEANGEALAKCKDININKVLVTCDKENSGIGKNNYS